MDGTPVVYNPLYKNEELDINGAIKTISMQTHGYHFEMNLDHINSDMENGCLMMLMISTLPRIWVHVNCSLKIMNPYFICENKIQKQSIQYKAQRNWCKGHMLYINTYCFSLMKTNKVQIVFDYHIAYHIEPYLTSLLKYKSKIILVKIVQQECIYAKHSTHHEQSMKHWEIVKEPCGSANWTLITTQSDTHELNCSESQFQCSDGSCILQSYYCDRTIDCLDKSDERSCPCNRKGRLISVISMLRYIPNIVTTCLNMCYKFTYIHVWGQTYY